MDITDEFLLAVRSLKPPFIRFVSGMGKVTAAMSVCRDRLAKKGGVIKNSALPIGFAARVQPGLVSPVG